MKTPWYNIRRFAAAILVSSTSLLQACSPLGMLNAIAPSNGVTVEPDIAYGTNPRQMLDLYRPTDASGALPTILFIYGGSWKDGARADYAFAGRALAAEGFLVAVADYRVFPEVKFPGFVDDAAKATAWLAANAPAHGGRATGIHLVGHSAGAHIVAMVALDGRYLQAAGVSRDVLGSWVGLAGPYAFQPSRFESVRDVFSGLADEDQARPIVFAGPDAPPALLLHGADDTTVVPQHSKELAKALNAAGAKARAQFYPDIGHAGLVVSLTSPFQGLAPTLADSVRFLKTGDIPQPPPSKTAAVEQ